MSFSSGFFGVDEDCRQDEQLPGLRRAETPLPSRRPSKLAHGMRLASSLSPIKCVLALLPSNGQCPEPFGALDLPHAQTFSSDCYRLTFTTDLDDPYH